LREAKKTISYMFFLCSKLAMDYIPLYPFDTDPFRILSPRRIREELPATPPPEPDPPDPPPPGEGTHPQDGGGAPSDDADAADWQEPPVPLHHAPHGPPPRAGEDADELSTEKPESPQAERIRLMRAWLNKHWDSVEAMARADETPQRPPPPPPEPEAADAPPPRVHVARGDRWNKPKMAQFLRMLAATHSVSAAARSVGMSRRSAYKLRARLKGQPFDIAWEAAFRHGYDNLAHAALERALNGVEVPHYCNGKLVGTSRKYDERLTVSLLAMRNRAGAPMLGRYGAAAEYWGDHWDPLLERIETGSVTWSDEHAELGEAGLAALGVPDAEREANLIIARNLPDERPASPRNDNV
jgi:hypothetical protein